MAELDAALLSAAFNPLASTIWLHESTDAGSLYDGEGINRIIPDGVALRGAYGERAERYALPLAPIGSASIRNVHQFTSTGIRYEPGDDSDLPDGALGDSVTLDGLETGGLFAGNIIMNGQDTAVNWFSNGGGKMHQNLILLGGVNKDNRGHFHGLYTHQNIDQGLREVSDNIFGVMWGIACSVYSAGVNNIRHYDFLRNFITDRFVVGKHATTAIRLIQNWFFGADRFDIGYIATSGDIELTDNRFSLVGGGKNVYIDGATLVSGSGNVFDEARGYGACDSTLVENLTGNTWRGSGANFTVDGNVITDFPTVQAAGVEVDSSYSTSPLSATVTEVAVNDVKDTNDPWCGIVKIRNYGGDSSVNQDLTDLNLQHGVTYRWLYYQDPLADQGTFVYDSGDPVVAFPLTGHTAAAQQTVSGTPLPHGVTATYTAAFVIVEDDGWFD